LPGKETRMKIGAGVRRQWEKRREKKKAEESCCFEWKNLIAEASRKIAEAITASSNGNGKN